MRKSCLRLAVVMLATLSLFSCKFKNDAQYTPSMAAVNFVRHPYCEVDTVLPYDTLRVKVSADGYVMDSINQLDTILFDMVLQSFANSLVSYTVTWDSTAVAMRLVTDSIASGLSTASVPESGVLQFKPGFNYASFPVRYVPKKAGAPKVEMTVESDSKYPTSTLSFIQPVR